MPVGSNSTLLGTLGDVKAACDKLGMTNFPMPQFILIGKQSVGKSRLIETLAGECFNFISGTLGSRRPTVLEFRNNQSLAGSQWHVRNPSTMAWEYHPVERVMQLVGQAHEELGEDVSSSPCYVRLESPQCIDMQIVDLPGFRDFALDAAKQRLADKIEALVKDFMEDKRNVMLCVEQAGDAATMSSLQQCRMYDPRFERTILIRNKLDKYYNDLQPDNIAAWVDGHGDLPANLIRFAVSLPHWKEGERPSKSFAALTTDCHDSDIKAMKSKGLATKYLQAIGFNHFAMFLEKKIESLFGEAVGPVLESMQEQQILVQKDCKDLTEELNACNPDRVLASIRDCGSSFSTSLSHIMQGVLDSRPVMTLEHELRTFHTKYQHDDTFCKMPSPDLAGLQDYLDYLRDEAELASYDVELNGGAQFRRVMTEIEIFLRFSEIAVNTKKRDVIQARGISMGSLTWRDVIVKLLSNEAHLPLQRRVRYVGERIRWFFEIQKEPILNFMCGLRDSNLSKLYSPFLPKHGAMIRDNEVTRMLVFGIYDAAVKRQFQSFTDLYENMLTSTFSNPWVFLKGATTSEALSDASATIESFKAKIPELVQSRSSSEVVLAKWLSDIPQDSSQIDEAIDKVQMLVLKTYGFIRAQVCDNVETFSESFFKLPMLRNLESDMANIQLNSRDHAAFEARREVLQEKVLQKQEQSRELEKWTKKVQELILSPGM